MRGATSAARLKRRSVGLEPPPDPVRATAGRKGAQAKHGKRMVDTRPGARIAGQSVAEVQQFVAMVQRNQQVTRAQAVGIAIEAAPGVAHRLVDLAMGRREFAKAPAAVQRAAMVDVLTIARVIGQEPQQRPDVPLNEADIGQLRALVGALESIQSQRQAVTVEDVELVDNSGSRQVYDNRAVDKSENEVNSTACDGSVPDSHSVGHVDTGQEPVDGAERERSAVHGDGAAQAAAGTPPQGAVAHSHNPRSAPVTKFPPHE